MTLRVSRAAGRRAFKAASSCSLVLTLACVALNSVAMQAQQSASQTGKAVRQVARMIRIAVTPKASSYVSGKDADLELALVDANNNPIKAPKDFKIAIEARVSGKTVFTRNVTVEKGHASEGFDLDIDSLKLSGAVEVAAKHPELLDGGTFIFIKPTSEVEVKPQPKVGKPTVIPRKSPQRRPVGLMGPSLVPGWALPPGYAVMPAGLASADVAAAAVAASGQDPPTLTLDFAPKRRFLADGQDPVTILVVLAQAFKTDIKVYLSTTAGTLSPQAVVVPAGEYNGYATLTSVDVGTAEVSYLTSTPSTNLSTQQKLTIGFHHPVTGFALTVVPHTVAWIDRADIIVTLLRDDRPTPTDVPRLVSLNIVNGRGEVSPMEIEIKEGEFEKRAHFLPVETGPVLIAARTADFVSQSFPVQVTALPYLVLLLTGIGGSVGGLVAFWSRKGSKWWRVVIGLVTGLMLYWAIVFGVLPTLSRGVALNPFSAFALPVLGGWLGTEVLAGLAKRVGIVT